MKRFDLDNFNILPHHILIAKTSQPDYEMSRRILLEISYDRYVVVEGYHCSCYGFDDSTWEATEYTRNEIIKLANAEYNKDDWFWNEVLLQV